MNAAHVERLGRYRLLAVIGSEAFASVYRAVDERLDDVVVVKLLGDNHCLNPDVRSRFIAEGRALRKVHSPHVISAYDIGENERQQLYLVLEYADRGTLADRVAVLRAGGWAPDHDDLRVVARSLAAAVDAVHRADLVHRDLSPSNLLLQSIRHPTTTSTSAIVASDERLVVADLGLCKDLALNSGLTAAGGTVTVDGADGVSDTGVPIGPAVVRRLVRASPPSGSHRPWMVAVRRVSGEILARDGPIARFFAGPATPGVL